MTAALPEVATFAEFARIARRKRSYVTELKGAGRLVLTDNGKAVRVRESLQRIEDTRDPARVGVVARHAAERQAKAAAPPPPAEALPAAAQPGGDVDPTTADQDTAAPAKETSMYQHWRERGERAKALAAERENAIAEGKLMDAAAVVDAVKSYVATLRAGLESLPDFLSPQLVGVKEEPKVRAVIAEAIEHRLAELTRQFGALTKETA